MVKLSIRGGSSVRGNVDTVSPEAIHGWIAELRDGGLAGSRTVYLLVDDQVIHTVIADQQRADVAGEFGGDDRCGFTFSLSQTTRERFGGREFKIIDEGTGFALPIPQLRIPTRERLLLDVGDTLIYFSHHSTAS